MARRPASIEISDFLNSRSRTMIPPAAGIVPALSNFRPAPIQINKRDTGGSQ
jgi:hypothetical protein